MREDVSEKFHIKKKKNIIRLFDKTWDIVSFIDNEKEEKGFFSEVILIYYGRNVNRNFAISTLLTLYSHILRYYIKANCKNRSP